jgi:hypothetical protein
VIADDGSTPHDWAYHGSLTPAATVGDRGIPGRPRERPDDAPGAPREELCLEEHLHCRGQGVASPSLLENGRWLIPSS